MTGRLEHERNNSRQGRIDRPIKLKIGRNGFISVAEAQERLERELSGYGLKLTPGVVESPSWRRRLPMRAISWFWEKVASWRYRLPGIALLPFFLAVGSSGQTAPLPCCTPLTSQSACAVISTTLRGATRFVPGAMLVTRGTCLCSVSGLGPIPGWLSRQHPNRSTFSLAQAKTGEWRCSTP